LPGAVFTATRFHYFKFPRNFTVLRIPFHEEQCYLSSAPIYLSPPPWLIDVAFLKFASFPAHHFSGAITFSFDVLENPDFTILSSFD
jgi:hypothetical protein